MYIYMNYSLWYIPYCSSFETIHVRKCKRQLQHSTLLVSKFAWSERVMEERTSRTRERSLDSSTTTPSGSTRFHLRFKITGAGRKIFQAQPTLISQKAKMHWLRKTEKFCWRISVIFQGPPRRLWAERATRFCENSLDFEFWQSEQLFFTSLPLLPSSSPPLQLLPEPLLSRALASKRPRWKSWTKKIV